MRRFLPFLVLASTLYGACPSGPSGYGYCRSITINHTKVGSTQAHFTALICFNSVTGSICDGANSNTNIPNLKVTGSGGQIKSSCTSTYPYSHTIACDAIFTDNSGSSLPFEVEKYTGSTGELIAWVNITSLSSSSDTIIYIFYSKASDSDHTSNAAWAAEWLVVYHAFDGSTFNGADSTSNANTASTTAITATTGDIDGGASLNGTSSNIATNATANTGIINITTSDMTAFVLAKSTSQSNNPVLIAQNNGATGTGRSWIQITSNVVTSSISGGVTTGSTTLSTGTWYFLGVSYDHTGHVVKLWVNGSQDATANVTAESANGSSLFGVNKATSVFYSGVLDEMSISGTLHDANWFSTMNNMLTPNSFYTLGAEQTPGGGGGGASGFPIVAEVAC